MEDFQKRFYEALGKELEFDNFKLDDFSEPDIADLNSTETTDACASETPAIMHEVHKAIDTYVDIVFCIDVTGSMTPILQTIKNLALNLYDDLCEYMLNSNCRAVKQLRVKVIAFRDYYCSPDPMKQSPFFILPDQKKEFNSYVANLCAFGGGDNPESALEAMAFAMKSDWVKVKDPNTERARNVVIVFTDAPAHPLERAARHTPSQYPKDMLKNYNELYEAWQIGQKDTCSDEKRIRQYVMDKKARRLIIFAPDDVYPWNDMAEKFADAVSVSISLVKGDVEIGREAIIKAIGDSVK